MKITTKQLKQLIKEELAEMQRADIDPDTLSPEDVLGTEVTYDHADASEEDKFLNQFAMVQALKKMDARTLAKVIADVVDDKEAFAKLLDLYSKTEDPFYK
jgi:hypothetical protein